MGKGSGAGRAAAKAKLSRYFIFLSAQFQRWDPIVFSSLVLIANHIFSEAISKGRFLLSCFLAALRAKICANYAENGPLRRSWTPRYGQRLWSPTITTMGRDFPTARTRMAAEEEGEDGVMIIIQSQGGREKWRERRNRGEREREEK